VSREKHDGRDDGLRPTESLDITRVDSFGDLLEAMARTSFGGRALGEAYEVLRDMVEDEDCTIVVTVSGAMSVAKMGRLLCEMISGGLANIVVSTGALMAHGLSEAIGGVHYQHDPSISDEQLFAWGYNRVYDTLEMEANLDDTERYVEQVVAELEPGRELCSWELNRAIGRRLVDQGMMPSILGTAFEHDVPVYVPAFTDSEIGLDVATVAMKCAIEGRGALDDDALFANIPSFNPFRDLADYTRRVLKTKALGIFTIGGGVPRNWAQQVGPFVDVVNSRLDRSSTVPRFKYGVRICPEPVHWGGLSGCSYSEGVSWGKFVAPEDGGRFAEVYCDATIAWPILIKAVLEDRGGEPPHRVED
jgi:deoxyhypusine synthase